MVDGVLNYRDFDYSVIKKIRIQKRKKGNPGQRNGRRYKNIICAFDIETSQLLDIQQAVMYIWQFQIGDITLIGRTWDEFIECLNLIGNELNEKEYIVIFDHNLSYEFQFLAGIYDFSSDEVFCMDSRKILKCDMFQHFEFRCSYIHSNMSLRVYLQKMGVKDQKISGFDYKKIRFPWTELSDTELLYCINDVRGLTEAIRTEMDHDADNLYTFPLTSTGYVRRDAKRAMKLVSHRWLSEQKPDLEIYQLCREAFRGGNTHANRHYAGFILENVHSVDRSSSYPDVQCNDAFPVTHFNSITPSVESLHDLLNRRKAVLMRVCFTGIRLKSDSWGCPYIPIDKCRNAVGIINDNGRVLQAEYLEITLTDIDYRIINEEYDFQEESVNSLYAARYGQLPRILIETTIDYYRKKTQLKNVEGQEIFYTKNKNKLNSIYGMMAMDPLRDDIQFDHGVYRTIHSDPAEKLEQYNRRSFLIYAWGVWVTAWARYRLEEGIRIAGYSFVYCDTDSVKYFGEADFSDFNRERVRASNRSGAYADDPGGHRHYMGVFEQERSYSKFVTLGAKKYAYQYSGSEHCHVTVSGVSKQKGGPELDAAGGLEAFRPGFIFRDAGGTELVYNDQPEITEYHIGGHTLPITRNVLILDSTYQIGITDAYNKLINLQTDADGYLMNFADIGIAK